VVVGLPLLGGDHTVSLPPPPSFPLPYLYLSPTGHVTDPRSRGRAPGTATKIVSPGPLVVAGSSPGPRHGAVEDLAALEKDLDLPGGVRGVPGGVHGVPDDVPEPLVGGPGLVGVPSRGEGLVRPGVGPGHLGDALAVPVGCTPAAPHLRGNDLGAPGEGLEALTSVLVHLLGFILKAPRLRGNAARVQRSTPEV